MYEEFFGLSTNPFRLQPDTRFFYWSRGHQAAHRSLHETLDHGGAFIAVTGEIGAGKTTLTQLLLSGVDPCLTMLVHLVSTQFDAANFVQALHIAFELPAQAQEAKPRSAREQLGQIEAYLLKLNRRGMKTVLVIDEAQNLSGAALNELFTLMMMLRDRNVFVLQCVLVGQPELSVRLEQAAQQRLGLPTLANFHLGQLETGELQAYVEHRLRVAGWKNNPRIDAGAYDVLYAATDGIPRRINSLCNRLLLGAFLAGKRRIMRGDVEATAAELRDELGIDALPSAGPRMAGPAAHGAKDKATMQSLLVSSLAARLDRLERNVTTMVRKVQLVFQARIDKPRAPRVLKPAGPMTKAGWRR